MIRWLFLLGVCSVLAACERSPFPEYKQIGENTHLRLYMLGEGDRLPRDGDSVLMRLRVSEVDRPAGSLFSTDQWYAVTDLRNSVFDELMIRMHEGDSMSVIAPSAELPWHALIAEDTLQLQGSDLLRTEASMLSIRTAAMMEAKNKELRASDPQAFERQLMFTYLDQLGSNWKKWGDSFIHYSIEGIATDSLDVKKGDIVTISYTGKRIEDGSTFDSSENNGAPYTFRFGDDGQVIKGVEIAITLLHEGQQGEFFFPSEYAFGERGVAGMIEPYTPVIYTVRLEEVQRSDRKGPIS